MLSYRSPVGLDQRFGREWFKKPGRQRSASGGSTTSSPGCGTTARRPCKRYDPYTYLLFSRAMDLARRRRESRRESSRRSIAYGCPVTVVGISSDQLYPASQVRLGVDILEHLGRPVTWQLISSPHGHDAFLLETGPARRDPAWRSSRDRTRRRCRRVDPPTFAPCGWASSAPARVAATLLPAARRAARRSDRPRYRVPVRGGRGGRDRSTKKLDAVFERACR